MRDTVRRRRGVDREREKPSWLSDLGCGEDTQEKCIPEAASEEKAQIREDRAEKS